MKFQLLLAPNSKLNNRFPYKFVTKGSNTSFILCQETFIVSIINEKNHVVYIFSSKFGSCLLCLHRILQMLYLYRALIFQSHLLRRSAYNQQIKTQLIKSTSSSLMYTKIKIKIRNLSLVKLYNTETIATKIIGFLILIYIQ